VWLEIRGRIADFQCHLPLLRCWWFAVIARASRRFQMSSCSLGIALARPSVDRLVMANYLLQDEGEKLFRKIRIKLRLLRQRPQARDLPRLAGGIGWRQSAARLQLADGLGEFEAFR